jgi:hypothetical protein
MAYSIPARRVKRHLRRQVGKIRYRGIFDMERLYKALHNWAVEREYEFVENRYKNSWRVAGAEVEIEWTLYRDINEFMRNEIKVIFHIWDYKEVDVVKDGKKKKMSTGRMYILFDGDLIFDYNDRWSDTKFKRIIRDWYIRNVVRKYIGDVWWDRLWYYGNKLQQEAKKALEMESHSDVYDDMW